MRSRFWKFHSILGRRFRFLAGELPQLTMCANKKSLKHMYCNNKPSKFHPLHPCSPHAFFSSNSFCALKELGWDRRDRRNPELKVKHESKYCAGVGRVKERGRERRRVGVTKKIFQRRFPPTTSSISTRSWVALRLLSSKVFLSPV